MPHTPGLWGSSSLHLVVGGLAAQVGQAIEIEMMNLLTILEVSVWQELKCDGPDTHTRRRLLIHLLMAGTRNEQVLCTSKHECKPLSLKLLNTGFSNDNFSNSSCWK